jgi:hypothetical protein
MPRTERPVAAQTIPDPAADRRLGAYERELARYREAENVLDTTYLVEKDWLCAEAELERIVAGRRFGAASSAELLKVCVHLVEAGRQLDGLSALWVEQERRRERLLHMREDIVSGIVAWTGETQRPIDRAVARTIGDGDLAPDGEALSIPVGWG